MGRRSVSLLDDFWFSREAGSLTGTGCWARRAVPSLAQAESFPRVGKKSYLVGREEASWHKLLTQPKNQGCKYQEAGLESQFVGTDVIGLILFVKPKVNLLVGGGVGGQQPTNHQKTSQTKQSVFCRFMYELSHTAWDQVLDRGLSLAFIYQPKTTEWIYWGGGAVLGNVREVAISVGCLGWFMFPCLHPSCSCLCIPMKGGRRRILLTLKSSSKLQTIRICPTSRCRKDDHTNIVRMMRYQTM